MDKVLPILEKYVEWIALGIAGLFLALMAYSYVVGQPVAVQVGTKEVPPSEVDPDIQKSSALETLRRNMSSGVIAPPPVPQATAALQNEINRVVTVTLPKGSVVDEPKKTEEISENVALVVPPVAIYIDHSAGWSLCAWPLHQAPPPGADGVNPGNPAGGPVQMVNREFGWWTGKFQVSNEQLIQAMIAANIIDRTKPTEIPEVARTAFLGVEVVRQEKLLGGGWGKETPVAVLPEFVPLIKPLPKDNANVQEKSTYMIWAQQNLEMLVQPRFPQVVAGDPWYLPGQPAPAAPQIAPPPFRPAPGTPGEFVPPPGQFNPGRRPVTPAARADLPGGIMLTSAPADVGMRLADSGVPFVPGNPEGGTPDYGGGASGAGAIPGLGDPDGVFYPQAIVAAAAAQGAKDYPTDVLVHDVTVQPGKTYHYRIRYHIRNPLFLQSKAKLEFRDKLVLTSAWSEWSKEYTVPARVEFWVNAVNTSRLGAIDSVDFDIFVADPQLGWKPEKVRALPGDQIAKGAGDSGWSLVDVRPLKDKNFEVIVADVNGLLQRRELLADVDDPKRRERAGVQEQPGVPAPTPSGTEGGFTPAPRTPGRGTVVE